MPSSGTVFVVDDDLASALSLQALLEAYGFDVRTFASAEEFLGAYDGRQQGCLVLDLRLPGMSGLELQRELIARNWRLPVIMISGHADRQSHFQAVENGAADFIEKPFSGADLFEAIRRATADEE